MSKRRRYLKFCPHHLKGCQCGNSFGFTIIELMVVMVVAAIIMAIAAISLRNVVRRDAAAELISELHVARLMAIRQHSPVAFIPAPNTQQGILQWQDEIGNFQTKTIVLDSTGERYLFDPNPPGVPPEPVADAALFFSQLGFISTPSGNVAGAIYITDQNNTKRFQIQTTIAGGIDLNRYNAQTNTWNPAY